MAVPCPMQELSAKRITLLLCLINKLFIRLKKHKSEEIDSFILEPLASQPALFSFLKRALDAALRCFWSDCSQPPYHRAEL